MAQHPHAGGLGTLLWYYQYTDSRVTISPTVEFTFNAHEDIMGSASYYTKQTGAVYEEHIYDAWGGVRWSTGHGVNDGKTLVIEPNYTGHSYDPILKIYHAEARFYDGKTRQWMASDPIKSGLNWYQYVASNPTNYVDPTGLVAIIGEDKDGNLITYIPKPNNQKDPEIVGNLNNITISGGKIPRENTQIQVALDTKGVLYGDYEQLVQLTGKPNFGTTIIGKNFFQKDKKTYVKLSYYFKSLSCDIQLNQDNAWFSHMFKLGTDENDFYKNKNHLGTDYVQGDSPDNLIRAIFKGKVVYSRDDIVGFNKYVAYGNSIVLEHEINGIIFRTLYPHMTKIDIPKKGEVIEAGQNIGIMGNTGNSYGAHLHEGAFVVLSGDQTANPFGYLTDEPNANKAQYKKYDGYVIYTSKEYDRTVAIFDSGRVKDSNGQIIVEAVSQWSNENRK